MEAALVGFRVARTEVGKMSAYEIRQNVIIVAAIAIASVARAVRTETSAAVTCAFWPIKIAVRGLGVQLNCADRPKR